MRQSHLICRPHDSVTISQIVARNPHPGDLGRYEVLYLKVMQEDLSTPDHAVRSFSRNR